MKKKQALLEKKLQEENKLIEDKEVKSIQEEL